jgi:putative ABC transport system substrate-binding protein
VELVATTSDGVGAVQRASNSLPIVAFAGDAVGTGLVASLARPGGNVTGTSSLGAEIAAKRLQLLQEVAPGSARVAVVWNENVPDKAIEFRQLETAAPLLGLELYSVGLRKFADLAAALTAATHERIDSLVVLQDNLTLRMRAPLAAFAHEERLPAIYGGRAFVASGGLMSYGPDIMALWQRLGHYAARILNGTKPADLPVEQPMTFDFVVNMKTARELGITFPREILLQVTEVVE